MTRSDLRHLLDRTSKQDQSNMLEGGAMVVGADSDTVFHIVKPKTVIIPWVDVYIPKQTPHDVAVKQRDLVTTNMVEALLWGAAEFNWSNQRTRCTRAQLLAELDRQLGRQALTSLYAAKGTRALEVCQGLGLPVLEGPEKGHRERGSMIIGLAEPVGYNLIPFREHDEKRGAGTFREGWMLYPASIAVCEVTSEG